MRKSRSGHVLATLMFTDIVDSTRCATELGDRRWRVLLARHHQVVRRAIKRHHGTEIDDAGDGFFVRFDDQVDAIRCASLISDEVTALGIEVRAGCHVGQAEVQGRKLRGVTVHAAARVMSEAGPSEVLVSSMLKELVPASGFTFTDRGAHDLKGIEGAWHLYAVTAVDGTQRPERPDPSELARRRERIEPPPLTQRRSGRVAIAACSFVVVLAAAVYISLRPKRIDVQPDSLVRIDPTTDEIVADVPVTDPDGAQLTYVPATNEVWVLSQHDQSISAVDASTYGVETVSAFPGQTDPQGNGYGILYAFKKVWVTGGNNVLEAIDPATKNVERSETIPDGPAVLAAGPDRIWATAGNASVIVMDGHFRVIDRIRTGSGGTGIVVGPDATWVADPGSGEVLRVDPASREVTKIVPVAEITLPARGSASPEVIPSLGHPSRLTVARDGSVWVDDNENGVVYRIDPFSPYRFRVYPVGEFSAIVSSGIAYLDGSIWVTDSGGQSVVKIDAASGALQDRIQLPYPPNGLAIGAGSVWVTVNPNSQ